MFQGVTSDVSEGQAWKGLNSTHEELGGFGKSIHNGLTTRGAEATL